MEDEHVPGLEKGEKIEQEMSRPTAKVAAVEQEGNDSGRVFKRILYASLVVMGIVFISNWISGLASDKKLNNTDGKHQIAMDKESTKGAATTKFPDDLPYNTNTLPTDSDKNINTNPADNPHLPTSSSKEDTIVIGGASINIPPSADKGKEGSVPIAENTNKPPVGENAREAIHTIDHSTAPNNTVNTAPNAEKQTKNQAKPTIDAILTQQGLAKFGVLSEGLLAVTKKGKKGFVDKNNKLVISCQFDDVQAFSMGYAGVKKDNRWTFIDTKGQFITQNPTYQFLEVLPFSSSKLAPVKVNFEGIENKWGYINPKGNRAIPFSFDKAGVFKGGKAVVSIGNKSFVINEKGDCLKDCPQGY